MAEITLKVEFYYVISAVRVWIALSA